jgi:hypothetical protein
MQRDDRQTGGQIKADRQTKRLADRQIKIQADRQTKRQADRQTEKVKDIQTWDMWGSGWINKQIEDR